MATIQKEVYDAFIDAGASEAKAGAAAQALAKNPNDMATKTDIAELESKLSELEIRLTWRMVTLTGLVLTAIAALAIFK